MKKFAMLFLVLICSVAVFAACAKEEPQNGETVEFEPAPGPQENTFFPEENDANRVFIETDAVWDGYETLTFEEFLKKGIPAVYEVGDTYSVIGCEVVVEEGWDCEGYLDESAVPDGNAPVTYTVDMALTVGGEEKRMGLKFYMEMTPENKLVIAGGESYEEGADWGEVFTVEDVWLLLEGLKETM